MTAQKALFIVLSLFLLNLLPGAKTGRAAEGVPPICGKCHGLTLRGECLAGPCEGRKAHPVRPLPWERVIPWMKAMGCDLTPADQASLIRFFSSRYEISEPIHWSKSGEVPGGWNVVSLAPFRGRLYAGIEGNGSLVRLTTGALPREEKWETVLQTGNYTFYGLTPYHDRLYAATHDPSAELWMSLDGNRWELTGKLPNERGITALAIYQDTLLAGSSRGWIYRSGDGKAWRPEAGLVPNGDSSFPNWVRFIIPYEGAVYAGLEGRGIFKSVDGISWKPFWSGTLKLPRAQGTGVRGGTVFKNRFYFGTTAGGEIWSFGPAPENDPRLEFRVDSEWSGRYSGAMAVFGEYLYAAMGGSLLRSESGSRWEQAGYLTPFTVESLSVYRNLLYAGTSLPPNAWIYQTDGRPAQFGIEEEKKK